MTTLLPAIANQGRKENRVDHKVSDDPKPVLWFRRPAAANGAWRFDIVVGHYSLLSLPSGADVIAALKELLVRMGLQDSPEKAAQLAQAQAAWAAMKAEFDRRRPPSELENEA